jgi:hypothetical protein
VDICYRNAIRNLLHAFDKPLIHSLLRIINQMKITFAYTVPKEGRPFTEFCRIRTADFLGFDESVCETEKRRSVFTESLERKRPGERK